MSSPFTSAITDLFHFSDPGQSAVIRKLSPRSLQAAQQEAQRKSLAAFRQMGGAALMRELEGINTAKPGGEAEKPKDPMDGYDAETLVLKGVVSWTYADKDPMDAEVVADMDGDELGRLARAILRLSRPSLFQDEAASEADRKND